jgi:NADPH:quinone reductase-like Zn-dependent oxidoreductase
VSENNVVHKPSNLTFTEAAVLPLVALTAWKGLVTEGKIQSKDRVLILGCTGGVGSAAVQIAKSFGARVTGICSGKHVDFAYQIGCDLVYDYQRESVAEADVFDLAFDATGRYHFKDFEQHLTEEAMFVSTRGGVRNFMSGLEAAIEIAFKKKMKVIMVTPNVKDLLVLKNLVEGGDLKPHIAKTFSIEQIGEAHRMVERGSFIGKVAVEI